MCVDWTCGVWIIHNNMHIKQKPDINTNLLTVAQCLELTDVSQEHLLVVQIIQILLLLLPEFVKSATQLDQVTNTLLNLARAPTQNMSNCPFIQSINHVITNLPVPGQQYSSQQNSVKVEIN